MSSNKLIRAISISNDSFHLLTALVSSRSLVKRETATYFARRVSTTVWMPISLSGSVSWTGLSAMLEQLLRSIVDLTINTTRVWGESIKKEVLVLLSVILYYIPWRWK